LLFDAFVICFSLVADVQSARVLLREGRVTEALRELEAVMRAAPDDPEVQFQAGEILRELGADRAARLEQAAPDSAQAHELVGRSLEARGKLDGALAEYHAALSKDPRLPGLHFLAGNIRWKQRDLEAARPEMEAELQLNPNHALANLRLGQILLAMNEPDAAFDHLRKAISEDGSSLDAHRALGQACRALGRHRQALQEFLIVARLRPKDDSVHAQLATVYRALGDAERAKAELEIHRRLLKEKAEAARKP
jgi:tetratricopeptide (TPR) repeat protein